MDFLALKMRAIHATASTRYHSASQMRVRVLHPSFVDFITNKERCTDSYFLVDVRFREIFLARRCLELMVGSLGHNLAGIEDEMADLEGRVKEAHPSELRYA